MTKQHHQSEIDILKIIAAIIVVLTHYTFRGYAADNMSTLHFPILGSIFKYGYLAIYIFFILSGYTIISSAENKTFPKFVIARVLRLYPSFWVAVCLTTLATFLIGGDRYHVEPLQFFANLTMLNGFMGIDSVDGAYWFIFVLLRFYFLIAMLILFKMIKFYKYIAGIWLILSLVITFYNIPHIGRFLIPQYAPFFISGMLFYSAKKEGWDVYKSMLILISFLFSIYQIDKDIPGLNKHYSTEISIFVVYSIISSIYLCIYFVCINQKQIHLSRAFTTLGVCTYPLYLIHQHIGFMLFNYYGHMANKYIILAITICLMFSLSFLIVKFIEPYIVNVMKRIIQFLHPTASHAI